VLDNNREEWGSSEPVRRKNAYHASSFDGRKIGGLYICIPMVMIFSSRRQTRNLRQGYLPSCTTNSSGWIPRSTTPAQDRLWNTCLICCLFAHILSFGFQVLILFSQILCVTTRFWGYQMPTVMWDEAEAELGVIQQCRVEATAGK
jgi:hypothetical protein